MKIFLISWALSAVLQQEFLLSSWLDVLQQSNFKEPVETAQDVWNRNIRIVGRYHIDNMDGDMDNDTTELIYPEIDLLEQGPNPELAERIGTSIQLSTG